MRSLRDDRDSSVADYSAAVPHISRGDRGSGLSCQRHDGPSGCSAHVDRLARSTRDLLNVLDAVAQRQAGFKSIADPMIDTTSPHGKLILAVLGALAEFERSMILSRTAKDALGLRLVVLDLVANRNSRHSKSARPWADAKPV